MLANATLLKEELRLGEFMKVSTKRIIENLTIRFPTLNPLKEDLENSVDALIKSFLKGGTLFVCGNGGSCSDSAHITGELVKSFCAPRKIRVFLAETRSLWKQCML